MDATGRRGSCNCGAGVCWWLWWLCSWHWPTLVPLTSTHTLYERANEDWVVVGAGGGIGHTNTHTLKTFFFPNQYDKGEDVIVWVNTVGPYNNRQETYSYYKLPFCRGQVSPDCGIN